MAVKDHSLDEKIINAAKEEFMENGFRKASLHKIVSRAGITTGALYTRYRGKDDLFCSLIEPFIRAVSEKSGSMRDIYMNAKESGSADMLIEAIRKEERIYLDLMFSCYDECVLFFCKSDGSSVETMITEMMEAKSDSTIEFLKEIAVTPVDFDGIRLIMSEQFYYYRQILQRGYSREKAVSCMETVEAFLEAGWKEIFRRIM